MHLNVYPHLSQCSVCRSFVYDYACEKDVRGACGHSRPPAYAELPDWVLFPWLRRSGGVGFKLVACSKKGS